MKLSLEDRFSFIAVVGSLLAAADLVGGPPYNSPESHVRTASRLLDAVHEECSPSVTDEAERPAPATPPIDPLAGQPVDAATGLPIAHPDADF